MIHPDDRERVEAAINRTIQSGVPYNLEFRLLLDDGRILWVADKARLRYDNDGKPSHLTGVFFDITERKQTEAALRLSEDRYRTLAHAVAQLMWMNDANAICNLTTNNGKHTQALPI